jgi:hypothetical protein
VTTTASSADNPARINALWDNSLISGTVNETIPAALIAHLLQLYGSLVFP